jgi:methionine-gamma-lyase
MSKFNPEESLAKARLILEEKSGVVPTIERSTTFSVDHPTTMTKIFQGEMGPNEGYFLYGRHLNPTVAALNKALAAMENTEAAYSTASGLGAIVCTMSQLCQKGDHIVSSSVIYGGTHALFKNVFPTLGIEVTFVNPHDIAAFKAAIKPNTKAFYIESVANPTLQVADLKALAEIAHANGISLVVDNTFMPLLISPKEFGADVVVHSLTKFINGASDVIGGVICGTQEFINKLMDLQTGRTMLFGPTMDPRAAFDVLQRLPHLALRMREHSSRTMLIAKRLEELKVKVIYPGLKSHPHHELLSSLLNPGYGFGGLIAVDCGTIERAEKFLAALQAEGFGAIAVSLGYYDTLMSCSGSSTSSEISIEEQQEMGLSPGLVRISIGYTGDINERMKQLEKAIVAAGL